MYYHSAYSTVPYCMIVDSRGRGEWKSPGLALHSAELRQGPPVIVYDTQFVETISGSPDTRADQCQPALCYCMVRILYFDTRLYLTLPSLLTNLSHT